VNEIIMLSLISSHYHTKWCISYS